MFLLPHPQRTSAFVTFGASLLALASSIGPSNAARLQGYTWLCGEQKQLCYWHRAVFDPPNGWVEDKEMTQRNRAVVMYPRGAKSGASAMMYVRAHNGDKALGIEEYASVAQERWRKRVPDNTIEALPDFPREGKPAPQVFLYKNPSLSAQAFELTAFLKDVDDAHPNETYFFQIVLSAPSMSELEKAKPAFYEVLKRL